MRFDCAWLYDVASCGIASPVAAAMSAEDDAMPHDIRHDPTHTPQDIYNLPRHHPRGTDTVHPCVLTWTHGQILDCSFSRP